MSRKVRGQGVWGVELRDAVARVPGLDYPTLIEGRGGKVKGEELHQRERLARHAANAFVDVQCVHSKFPPLRRLLKEALAERRGNVHTFQTY